MLPDSSVNEIPNPSNVFNPVLLANLGSTALTKLPISEPDCLVFAVQFCYPRGFLSI